MPQESLSMRRLREVLRLKLTAKLSNRAIGRSVNISPGTVSYYTRAAFRAGLDWSTIEQLSDNELIERLRPYCDQLKVPAAKKQEPDYIGVYQELKKKGVTLQLLHEEYELRYGKKRSYSYSLYCQRYRNWLKQQKPSMRISHKGGEKIFVDYAGPSVNIYHPQTGEIKQARIFVGVLGASNYTFAEATLSRSSSDWIGSHIRMLNYFGGVPSLIIPDNEKAAVNQACYYDPEINPNYAAFAAHYGVSILPTRPGKPKDKAKVENAVQVVERWILARLRHFQFFSLAELNQAISQLLKELNNKPFKKLSGTRLSCFEALDKAHLKALPKTHYEIAQFRQCAVRLDYHIEIDKHLYSVPYTLVGRRLDCRISRQLVEIYYQHKRVATHTYSQEAGKASTCILHMPKTHRYYQEWTPHHFEKFARDIGENMLLLSCKIIKQNPHPVCCQRIHLGLRNLAKHYGKKTLEQACYYALKTIENPCYRSIKSILKTKLYLQLPTCFEDKDKPSYLPLALHENIRGHYYYQSLFNKE